MHLVNSLTYRSTTEEARINRVLMRVRNVQGWFWLRTLGKLAAGIPLSFLGPAIVAGLFHGFFLRIGARWAPDWLTLFFISCLIIIPMLYYAEWRSNGNFFLDEMRAQGASADCSSIPASYGEFRLRQGAAIAAMYTEISRYAPRLVFAAIFDLRQRIELTYDELCRGAQIVLELSSADGGILVKDLRRAGDAAASFRRILQYLRFHDWIGISKRGDRAWLLSTARRRIKTC